VPYSPNATVSISPIPFKLNSAIVTRIQFKQIKLLIKSIIHGALSFTSP